MSIYTGAGATAVSSSSVDELAKAVGIDPSKLDKRCAKEHIEPISQLISNWCEFSDALGLSDKDKDDIESNNLLQGNQCRALEMLKVWRKKNDYTPKVYYREFVRCALDQSSPDRTLAGEICELLT